MNEYLETATEAAIESAPEFRSSTLASSLGEGSRSESDGGDRDCNSRQSEGAECGLILKECQYCKNIYTLDNFEIMKSGNSRKKCKKCRNAESVVRNKEWRKNNRDKESEARKRRYQKRKEENPDGMRIEKHQGYIKWRDKDPERAKEQSRNHPRKKRVFLTDEERYHLRIYHRNYYYNNIDRERERKNISSKKYQKSHPEKVLEHTRKRRSRKNNAPVNDFTSEDWEFVKSSYGHKCYYCGKKKKLTADHITPLSKNGDNSISNIVPSCLTCNVRKHANNPPVPVQPLLYIKFLK